MIQEEIWKDVVSFGGKYSVSNLGRVRSNFTISKLGKKRPLGTILKTSINKRGYEKVKLILNGDAKTLSVHRLVCTAFHPNPENKPQVNHKDLNQINNHYLNLEWATAKENVLHAQINGRIPIAVPYVKKDPKDKFKKIVNIETGETDKNAKEISLKLGLNVNYFWKMLRGERPNTTPYRYVGSENIVKKRIYKVEQKYPIALFDKDWNLLGEFNYLSEMSKIVIASRDTIRDFIKGRISQYKGFKFKLIDEDGNHIEPVLFIPKQRIYKGGVKGRKMSERAKLSWKNTWNEKKKNGYQYPPGREIIQKDLNGVEIQRFISLAEAVRFFGVKDKSDLRRVLSGKRGKTYKGYKWEYAE